MLTLRIEIPGERDEVWSTVRHAMQESLRRAGIAADWRPDGMIRQHDQRIGRVRESSAERIVIEWRAAPWTPGYGESTLELSALQQGTATQITLVHRGFDGVLAPADQAAWFGSQLGSAFLHALSPAAVGDWVTDRNARRPWGDQSRLVYGDPLYHYPNFRVILTELELQPGDHLLEVGCGGGVLLRDALATGCRAAGVDHSLEMIELAGSTNVEAIHAQRLALVAAAAEDLPFAGDCFSCAVMTGVLGFLAAPVRALTEIRRVLSAGGRLVALGSDPEMKGTPAAPEPFASRLRFYSEYELAALAKQAGFSRVEVVRRDLEQHARSVGIPEEHIPLFAGSGTTFLLARK